MRILLLSQQFDVRGGSDVMVHVSKRLLEEAGHEVFLFAATPEADETFPSDTHFEKPSVGKLHRFLYHREAATKLGRFLDQNPVDIAHAHIYYGKLTSAILGPLKRRGIPLLQHLHEYRSFCSISVAVRDGTNCEACSVGNYWAGLRYRCNRGSFVRSFMSTVEMYSGDALGVKSYPSRFLTVSQFQKRLLVRQGMDEARIDVLYNPVDSSFFDVGRIGGGGVFYSGRLEDYKGVLNVLDVAEGMPGTRFVIAGDGGAKTQMKQIITERQLNNVELVGHLDRAGLMSLMAQADVALVPSIFHETFGLVAAEAQAAGIPLIVSDAGGLPEVVEDGVTGIVVPRGNSERLQQAVSQITSSADLAQKLSVAGRNRARTHFSSSSYLAGLETHLETIVRHRQGRSVGRKD